MHARTIGLAIAQEQNAAAFNENDSTPGGVLEHPMKLSDPARKNLEESWNRRHKGPANRRTVAILEEGMKWHQTGLPPDDAKLVEQMQLTPAMVARIFRVPPHKIAAGIQNSSGTYSNVEHQDIEFVNDTLRPWAERGEGEADVKLFGRNNQQRLITVIDMTERLRGDMTTRTAHARDMFDRGAYSVNEVRSHLGKPGIGPDGDKRFVPLNMQLLENAGEGPPPEPAPAPKEEPADDEADEPSDDRLSRLQSGCLAVLTDACRRMLKRENDSRHLEGDALAQWLSKHRDYCRETLTPPAALLSECFGANGAATEVAVSLFLDKHLTERGDRTPEDAALDLRAYLLAAAAAKE
jgi:hypothetical protein